MSQAQPRRPQQQQESHEDPIKYGDVFPVAGELASKPVAPRDAAMMQTAENLVFGQTQKGGPASAMQSAATVNERVGLVGHRDVTDVAQAQGVTLTETDAPGARIITESVGGQVVGQFVQPTPVQHPLDQGGIPTGVEDSAITIGEALEVVAYTAGDKPIEQKDAAAIQAAEVRATGSNLISPDGVAAAAQSATAINTRTDRDEEKIKLADVVTNATVKMPADKAATRQDAEGVVAAELRNDPNLSTQPGRVAASVTAAARLNEQNP